MRIPWRRWTGLRRHQEVAVQGSENGMTAVVHGLWEDCRCARE